MYTRLGEVYVIADLVSVFSDALLEDRMVGRESKNEQLSEWSNVQAESRLNGLKFQRTLWLCEVAGGPQKFVSTRSGQVGDLNLKQAHCPLEVTPEEFDRVAMVLRRTLAQFNVPEQESSEVLAAFGAHKPEVTACPHAAKPHKAQPHRAKGKVKAQSKKAKSRKD